MKWILFLIFVTTGYSADFKIKEIVLSGTKLTVEIADDDTLRGQGLMNRKSLGETKGMLFIFNRPQPLSFWMKNTYIPLSIGYFDEHKVLKEVHEMDPQNIMERQQNLKSYPSQCVCQYALEVNKGWFKKNKIKLGTKFSFIKKE